MRYAITPLPPTPDEIHELEARERDIRQAQVQDDDVVYESGSEKENCEWQLGSHSAQLPP